MEKFYMLGGLPRSGSTLLCNILAQNPNVHATHSSGCMDVMFGVRNQWDNLIEHKAHPDNEAQRRVLAGIPQSYYGDITKPIVIDKCRGWVSLIEMAEFAFQKRAKIIVPVRSLEDILTSMEILWRKQAATGQIPGEAQNYSQMQTTQGRCEYWLRSDQVIGLAVNRVRDAFTRGFADRLCLVPFNSLTENSQQTMNDIYNFLEEDSFSHDFNNVQQLTTEDDSVHGFDNLHTIRPQVRAVESRAKEILGVQLAEQYSKVQLY